MKTKQKRIQLPVIICFFGFFLACLVWGLLQPDRAKSEAENRPLTQRPAMRRIVTDFDGFARAFDSYAADQFPGREQRIRDYTVLELAQGKKLARKAYCLNGWLFTKLGHTNPEQMDELQAALSTAADTGLPLVYCAVPLKNEVLHDIDPSYFSDEVGAENKEALFAMLAGVDRLTAIDASAPLLAGSLAEREQLFYKTDFHWNARGAFAASQEIARQLAASGLIDAASIPQADAFVWSELGTEKQYQGDLNSWFSDLLPMQEAIPRFVPGRFPTMTAPAARSLSRAKRSSAAALIRTPSLTTTSLPTISAITAWRTPMRRRPDPSCSSRIPSRMRRPTISRRSSARSTSLTRARTAKRRAFPVFWQKTMWT